MNTRALSLITAAGLTLAACSHTGVAAGQARLAVAAGARVTLARAGHSPVTVRGHQTLRQGDRVKVGKGTATLTLPGNATLELRGPRQGRGGSDVRLAATPALLGGDALVRRDNGSLTVSAGGSKATVHSGAARVSRALSVTAAAYAGQVTLTTTGRSLTVPALRQATIPVLGVLPGRPSPLALDSTDPWDNRFLGLAIDLSQELQQESDGFSSNLPPSDVHSAGFFKQLVPALAEQTAFGADLIDQSRPAGETLVGAAIAVTGTKGSFGDRWSSIFSFRNDGAAWGLVALDQAITDTPGLSATVQAALGRATFQPATIGGAQSAAGVTAAGVRGAGGGNGGGRGTTTTGRPGGPGTTTTTGPLPKPPVTTPIDPVVSQVVQAVNNLLGG